VTWSINPCLLKNLKPIKLTDIIGVLVGDGRQMIPIDFGISRSKVMETWSIKKFVRSITLNLLSLGIPVLVS